MSEPENFLSRWARLKREATEPAKPSDNVAPADGREPAPKNAALVEDSSEPVVDLSTLPSIDAIDAATDIRAFLAPGVPAELTRAALRRAWVADPAIRDFIGLAENQWDFTAPDAIPGFGTLGPLDDVRKLVAEAVNDLASEPHDLASASAAPKEPQERENREIAAAEDASEPAIPGPPSEGDGQSATIDIAMRNEHADPPPPARRRRGGALPR